MVYQSKQPNEVVDRQAQVFSNRTILTSCHSELVEA